MGDILDSWILWTCLAAGMQSVRTAAQKYLTGDMSAVAATLVRYLFGLPFALAWFAALAAARDWHLPDIGLTFLICGLLAGILQILATVLLVHLFTLRNFAVGNTYVRSEIVLTALIGYFFFSEAITLLGWIAVLVCVSGLVLISLAKTGRLSSLWNESAMFGLGSGLAFALTSLLLRKGSLSLPVDDPMLTASMTLLYMVLLQTCLTSAWVAARQPEEFGILRRKWRACLFVGATGVAGSVGWFTAMTLELAAYVKTLGQIEFLFSLSIAWFYFRERPRRQELIGMVLIVAGALGILIA
ncbi:MAG: DMT family transporter [Pseudomonadales bacterium]|nr:DMT family transporter [Pseudomonadales bacterium]